MKFIFIIFSSILITSCGDSYSEIEMKRQIKELQDKVYQLELKNVSYDGTINRKDLNSLEDRIEKENLRQDKEILRLYNR